MIAAIALIFALHGLYAIKCWLGINLLKQHHFPDLIEQWTFGIVRSKWVLHPKTRRKHKRRKHGSAN